MRVIVFTVNSRCDCERRVWLTCHMPVPSVIMVPLLGTKRRHWCLLSNWGSGLVRGTQFSRAFVYLFSLFSFGVLPFSVCLFLFIILPVLFIIRFCLLSFLFLFVFVYCLIGFSLFLFIILPVFFCFRLLSCPVFSVFVYYLPCFYLVSFLSRSLFSLIITSLFSAFVYLAPLSLFSPVASSDNAFTGDSGRGILCLSSFPCFPLFLHLILSYFPVSSHSVALLDSCEVRANEYS